ncbi:hypothetical protein GYB59_00395 [bacterium]|uniref:Transmembrane protein n=1 Tax=Rubinisphaera brasiliensis (strain ATCC 49424 / DSM 5305 / JCM 21570 / IAM 15109 / NBRC 103401 / IFAM 1448) TaxID=756272 RepID=F0SNM2_RUBBR|nr:hypothetical protein [Rubinisphaera brasiliensis]ADY58908.1 hypothetical protein Plabr_1296 [Rubinisphaera brasiliensis DSM 5305]MBB01945.1 hypothetical protein [Planctomyces sp.]MBR9800232.1 hypothetical protein [bacterium]
MLTLVWFFLTLLSSLACAVLAVLLPAAVKKLGLFSIALGAGVAASEFGLRRKFNLPRSPAQGPIIILLAGAAEFIRVYESFRQFASARSEALERQLAEHPMPDEAMFEEIRQQAIPTWDSFLAFRYSSLPIDFANSPALAWGLLAVEVLLAMLAAGGLWWYLNRPASSAKPKDTSEDQPGPQTAE